MSLLSVLINLILLNNSHFNHFFKKKDILNSDVYNIFIWHLLYRCNSPQQTDDSVSFSCSYFSSPVMTQAYSQPFNITASPSRDGVRGHRRRSLSLDHQQLSLDSSLTRALTAARNMKEVSHRMAHSLSSGLHCSSFLTTSCTYWHQHLFIQLTLLSKVTSNEE